TRWTWKYVARREAPGGRAGLMRTASPSVPRSDHPRALLKSRGAVRERPGAESCSKPCLRSRAGIAGAVAAIGAGVVRLGAEVSSQAVGRSACPNSAPVDSPTTAPRGKPESGGCFTAYPHDSHPRPRSRGFVRRETGTKGSPTGTVQGYPRAPPPCFQPLILSILKSE